MSVSYAVLDVWRRYLGHCSDIGPRFVPNIVVRELSPNLIEVEVRVPFKALACEAEGILNRNYRQMYIKGFRPGHGPRYLVVPYIRRWLLVESLNELLLPAWDENVAELPGQLVETSELRLDVSNEEEEYLVVSCQCEVMPRVELQPLSSTSRPVPDSLESNSESNQESTLDHAIALLMGNPVIEVGLPETERLQVDYDSDSSWTNDGFLVLQEVGRTAESEAEYPEGFDSLCHTTNEMTPPSLVELLTSALGRVTEEQLNPESVKAAVQNKLHEAQVARAVLDQYADKVGRIDLEYEVARRATVLGVPFAAFRARYLANEEQRELFMARVRQDRALRLRCLDQQDSV